MLNIIFLDRNSYIRLTAEAGWVVEEPTISSAFQPNLEPNYSGEDSRGTFMGVGRSWMSFRMWQDAKACVCVSLFCFHLPVLVFHWAIPKHSSFFLCRSCCVGSLPRSPRVNFPVPFSFPAIASLDFVSDFPRKGLYGGHRAENRTFLTRSLGKQTKQASPSFPLFTTSCLHCASKKSQLFKKKKKTPTPLERRNQVCKHGRRIDRSLNVRFHKVQDVNSAILHFNITLQSEMCTFVSFYIDLGQNLTEQWTILLTMPSMCYSSGSTTYANVHLHVIIIIISALKWCFL